MNRINRESRTSIYYGINYVLASPWNADKTTTVELQKALLENELDFAQTNFRGNSFTLTRNEPSSLQIKLESLGPQVSGIHVASPNPQHNVEMFVKEADAAYRACQHILLPDNCQIINCTARIRHLYSSSEHAFKYLWETRLGQMPEDFRCLGGRPVAGGGMRLLMPPHAIRAEEPRSVEIRIESFLREKNKLLVETAFTWPRPRMLHSGEKFDPGFRLKEVEKYAAAEVWNFLVLKEQSGPS